MWIWTAVLLCCVLPHAAAYECNNLKRFKCMRGAGQVNGCTWAKDKFKAYRHFPGKKRLYGVCLNSGQSKSVVFGTPTDRCDCGTKCRRKCKHGRGYKKKCYWAGPRLSGTCLPTKSFAATLVLPSCPNPNSKTDDNTALVAAIAEWKTDPSSATATYGPIEDWDVACVEDFSSLFRNNAVGSSFVGDVSKWDTGRATSMAATFINQEVMLNYDVSKWDVTKVTDFSNMFRMSSFVGFQSLSKWDTSNGEDFSNMFLGAEKFNGNISKWNISKGLDFSTMFKGMGSPPVSVFNQDLSKWDSSQATSIKGMFQSAVSFNQDLSKWNTDKVSNAANMFLGATAMNCTYYNVGGQSTAESNCAN